MNIEIDSEIKDFISDRNIIKRKILSKAFNIICEKVTLDTGENLVFKYYEKKNKNFNSIKSETNSLKYLLDKFPSLFPAIRYFSENILVIEFVDHNNIKNNNYQKILAKELFKLHKTTNDKYGFKFNTQIGGLENTNYYDSNWVNFYRNQRLGMIFDLINKDNSMPININKKLELLIRNLDNYIPKNPKISLLHGDLWEGNILFNNNKLVSFIDPGIFFGHNEMEIAYLTWFNYVDKNFIDYYSNEIKINLEYKKYEKIYQLYYCLLNVYLWDRSYIKNTQDLLNKIKI